MDAGSIVERILDPLTECLTQDAASQILEFKIDAVTQSRVNELAEKSEAGELTDLELSEYRGLIEAFDLVAILKSRARVKLAKAG